MQTIGASIDSLRSLAKHSDALAPAKELLALKKSTPATKEYEIADAEWLIKTLEFIAALPESSQRELAEAYVMTARYETLYGDEKYDEAISLARDQSSVLKRLLDSRFPEVATSLNNLGYLLFAAGDYEQARPCYREALAIDRTLFDNKHPNVAIDLNNLAGLLQETGDYAGAETLYRESLELSRALLGEQAIELASVLSGLGSCYQERGDLVAAEPLYRKALSIYRQSPDATSENVAQGLENLGTLLAAKGDEALAESLFGEALNMYRALEGDTSSNAARTLVHLASIFHDLREYESAETLYRQALAIYDQFPYEVRATTSAMNNLAELLHDRAQYATADSLYQKALEVTVAQYPGETVEKATMLTNRARNLRDCNRYDVAEPLYLEAIAIIRKLLGEQNPQIAASLYSYSNLLVARGEYGRAEGILAEALKAYESSRSRVGNPLERSAFLTSPYPSLANVYLNEGKFERAWPAAEKDLGRALADLVLAAGKRSLTVSEMAREDSLSKSITYFENELAAYGTADAAEISHEDVENTRSLLLSAEQEWSEFQLTIAEKHPITEGKAFPLERIQKALPKNTAIIGWLDVEEKKGVYSSWAYVIKRSGGVTWARLRGAALESSASPFNRSLSFRNAILSGFSREKELTRQASELWESRTSGISPVLRGCKNLIVIPSGAMLGIPVEALVDSEGVYVGDRYTVSYAPSATIYAWLEEQTRKPKQRTSGNTLLVGDPPFTSAQLASMERQAQDSMAGDSLAPFSPDSAMNHVAIAEKESAFASLPRLIGTRNEITKIASLTPSATILLGPKACEEELYNLSASGKLGEYSVIHIATHALIDDIRPERSALILSQVNLPDPLSSLISHSRVFDGLLTAKEIVGEWNITADLVALSACATGLGKKVGGEGYIGFSHAFFQAGARSLLVSLWKVNDEATSLLMQRFYENYLGASDGAGLGTGKKRMTKAEALQEAKRYVRNYVTGEGRRPFNHPYYWSSFILIGDCGK